MNIEKLQTLFKDNPGYCGLVFIGVCHDCKREVTVDIDLLDEGFSITGGALYNPGEQFYIKCDDCFSKKPKLKNFQPCEVYSRVVGYLRPTSQWNPGKKEEFKDRKLYNTFMGG